MSCLTPRAASDDDRLTLHHETVLALRHRQDNALQDGDDSFMHMVRDRDAAQDVSSAMIDVMRRWQNDVPPLEPGTACQVGSVRES